MTCQDLDDALLDLARGTTPGPGSVAAVESHVEHCGRCAARLARERELTTGLRALAASTASQAGSPALEQQLLRAFAELHPAHTAESHSQDRRRWLGAAAAAVVIAGAGALGVAVLSGPEQRGQAPDQASQVTPAPVNQVAPSPKAAALLNPREATRPDRPARPQPPRKRGGAERPEPASMEGFVALPAAAGLPTLESGRIIRIDLPVASLPAYGVDVIPDARRPEVEADLLVGQDGLPRAIRLVTVSSNSRSRE